MRLCCDVVVDVGLLYPVAKNLATAANLFVVASVQVDCEPAKLIVVVKLVAWTVALEMAATLTHCVTIFVVLKPLVVATCMQNDGLFGCLGYQNQFQTAVAITLVHYFPTVVDVYLLNCFC